jgi:acetolactate synthase-1/2/3 large subunit
MGFSVGAVVGARLASPESTCVAICGDGGFLMHVGEVSTASQKNVGAIWVVWSENDLNMVSQGMGWIFKDGEAYRDYYKIGAPDLVKVAEGLGADAVAVRTPAAFETAFLNAMQAADQGRPQVIVVHEDSSAMPPFYINQFPWNP